MPEHRGTRGGGRGGDPASAERTGLVVLAACLALPLLGLGLLLWRPEIDVAWEDHPAHFWLVLAAAATSAVLASVMGTAARRRGDARVLLASYAFLVTAAFLGLHALATPKVLLDTPNAGFVLATPAGLALGAVFAVWSGSDLSGERDVAVVRRAPLLQGAIIALAVGWAVFSLAQIWPFDAGAVPEQVDGLLAGFAGAAVVGYAVAAWRYLRLWRDRRTALPLAVASAFVLLAEASVAVAFSRNWHLSWWEWHVLMLAAVLLVALVARSQWHEERFAALYLDDTTEGERDMSILFADLQGFTTFSEAHEPREVTQMLNTFFEVAVPAVAGRYGGDVDRIIGDALMVTFNRRGDQPDHARRAVLAGLALQEATAAVLAEHPDWPTFRVGINSGPVSVSVLGTAGGRTHTVIGDTVNTASRIEGKAPAGGVAVSAATLALLPDARAESLGFLELKGKAEPVELFQVDGLGAG
ncbi:adenylate/guanylate cyclase domain-containing protein [Mumia zhuanghuii]|uniref:Adenylate/guanylate cyclase domain-containing protein n=2 Tax=Mumia TaxID=1546255 RepID=A0ABW1QKQ8_9ACTN|nr:MULTISPECIES: adenylate/guanylate cyclase domain-containing protein [Mumia]KAA1423374.1 adenylate/guanylate cyclase domain-containing protein [Mumia zhuanghuii]